MQKWHAAAIAAIAFVAGMIAGFGVWERVAWQEVTEGMKNGR